MGKTHRHKSKSKSKDKKRHTKKHRNRHQVILSDTPIEIADLSQKFREPRFTRFFNTTKVTSYAPTINEDLVTLKSIPRTKLSDCNNAKAFQMQEPLQIGIPGSIYGKTCFLYSSPEAKQFLLKNLSANKHVRVSKIVPPIQNNANCWFNAFFACFFISDKGRKFFHYFRQLMIEGRQHNGTIIPKNLADGFALLNFAVDAALTGNKYAYEMDTNNIIIQIYKSIPDEYHRRLPYLVQEGQASNPVRYYSSILYYLKDTSLQLLFVTVKNQQWKNEVLEEMSKSTHLPHVIVIEIFDAESNTIDNKATDFIVNSSKYSLDSCVIRDKTQQHFCSLITCEKREMGYDGMSFHRIVPMKWKNNINTDSSWSFEGSTNRDGKLLEWDFLNGYQMLLYYRTR